MTGIRAIHRRLLLLGVAVLLFSAFHPSAASSRAAGVVRLDLAARDSMTRIFLRFNAGWDQQADLNTMERMLGTVRPGALEYLGCLAGEVRGDTVHITHLIGARRLRQLPQAVTGRCDSIPGVVGTWHTHPFHPDTLNRALKSRVLSERDLQSLQESPWRVQLMMWDADSLDAALRSDAGAVEHPASVEVVGAAP